MKKLIKDMSTMEIVQDFLRVNKVYHETRDFELTKDWELKYKRVKRRLSKITTGRVRYIDSTCRYQGKGYVRIEELDGHSVEVGSFHKSSDNHEYKMNTTLVKFDKLDFYPVQGGLHIEISGLQGPVEEV